MGFLRSLVRKTRGGFCPDVTSKPPTSKNAQLRHTMDTHTSGGPQWISLRNELVEANLGLVRQVSRKLGPPYGFIGDRLEEAESEVAYLLTEMIPKWNPDETTLAAMLYSEARSHLRAVRDHGTGYSKAVVPARLWSRVTREERYLADKFGRQPTDQEIAKSLSTEQVTPDIIAKLRTRFGAHCSLHENSYVDAGDSVVAPGESQVFIEQMIAVVAEHSPKMAEVFAIRFGMDEYPPPPSTRPWKEVASKAAVSEAQARSMVLDARQIVAAWLSAAAAA